MLHGSGNAALGSVLVVGTFDTKASELVYLAEQVANAGGTPLLVDIGTTRASVGVDVGSDEVAAHHPQGVDAVLGLNDRGSAVSAMGIAFADYISSESETISGIIGAGGSGGTSVITSGMRRLPLGIPKVIVSTVASGNVTSYVGVSDITMMYSVTDIAGLNHISRTILQNAAYAVVGMVSAPRSKHHTKSSIGMTMFGVTTPCVQQVMAHLENDYDCVVFHATGVGGQAMEKLLDSGFLAGAIDVTTTEVADYLVGGVMPATSDRFGAFERSKLPLVLSVGAVDMVNFGAPGSVPPQYAGRRFYRHNAEITLMRTTAEENIQIGAWIAERLNRCEGPVRILLPENGVSALDAPGQPFHDPEADAALFETLEKMLHQSKMRTVTRVPVHINDPTFSKELVQSLREVIQ